MSEQASSFELPEAGPVSKQTGSTFGRLVSLMQLLLAPDGCPWDREQTPLSLRQYVLEEACEVIDAIESGDRQLLCEELGDLALQVAFLSELARREGSFGPDDVMRGICEKLVRRHPHVFGDAEVADPDMVTANWERIKGEEKRGRPLLDSIPRNLPALWRAEKTSRKASQVGFDWPDADSAREKVEEEVAELEQALTERQEGRAASAEGDAPVDVGLLQARVEEEYGDLLFALVNWGRHLGVSPEAALRQACDKFRGRFDEVERRVRDRHGDWPRDGRSKPTRGLSLEELDAYWEQAKLKLAR
jgi:MazG family protein